MIIYSYDEEKLMALFFADILNDGLARKIIEAGTVANSAEATHLSKFYWRMIDAAVVFEKEKKRLPFDGNSEYWTEKLGYSLSGYLENAGYEKEWDTEGDNANPY